jgi:hypothetical protein
MSLLAISIILILLTIGAIAGSYHYKWVWAGFSERRFVKAKDEEVREARTLWDWLQLLIIPAALASIAVLFNQVQADRDRTRADERARVDREIAADNQQEEALGSYTEAMSKLMLESHLRDDGKDSELRVVARRVVARTRTLSALRRLNGERKGIVLRFLMDASLIRQTDPAVNMTDADLSSTIARQANLSEAHLIYVDLHEADLSGSNLEGADLHGSNLERADLDQTSLGHANLADVDLTLARLDDSYLLRANMPSAKLCGASLRGAELAGANLNDAIADNDTLWPADFDWRSAGVTLGRLKDGKCEDPDQPAGP